MSLVLIIFGYSYAQELPKKEQSKPTQTEQNPATYNRGTKDLPITIEIAPSAPLKIETDRDKEAENEKALNEWLTARGTAAIAVFTLVLACATIGLAVFTYSLWGETGKLVIGANDTARRQLRAYVAATPTMFSGPSTNLSMRFSMINHGQTPAYNVVETGVLDIFPYPLPPNFPFPALPVQQHSRTVLHPHATNMSGMARAARAFTLQEIGYMFGKENRIYIYGLITYTDVFKERHKTEFCHSIPKTMNLLEFLKGSVPLGTPFDTEAANQHDETD